MFYQDFSVVQGVLAIDAHHALLETQVRIAPGDGTQPHPDPRSNFVVMMAPGDGPQPPPDPK